MTPERWRQVGELFEQALLVEPEDREAWLAGASAGDDALRHAVGRLLQEDERANRVGFLPPPETSSASGAPTMDWTPPVGSAGSTREGILRLRASFIDETGGFTPRQAIVSQESRRAIAEPPDVVRARLRELPLVYILILCASLIWRYAVFGENGPDLYLVDGTGLIALLAIVALLWSRVEISLAGLKALELGMIGLLAARVAFVQYRLMLAFSRLEDRMMAQLTFKNIVLLTAVLILTYGLFVPKSWRRAAVVVVPLALLPFVTLAALAIQQPVAMDWLFRGWQRSTMPRIWLFTFDGIILAILAVGATYGARAISRLRRQVAEARQLGQYRLRRRIGAGGMGEVYLAEHLLLKRPCAVKLIRRASAADPRALQRFEREVRLTSTLSHPNTVDVYDYGQTEDGTYYYVMEYLQGLGLAELVERHGPLAPGRVVFLLRQVCGALREAHAAGLVHRDIKPSNIFAARRGGLGDVAKLLDFGLVLPTIREGVGTLSGEEQILGTPLFMAPEQATGGRETDARSDIYALGAVAYYLLTGRPPFDESSRLGALIAHARDPVVPPSRVTAGIPDDLERAVLRCLEKDPSARFPDAASFGKALAACACASDWTQELADRWWRDQDKRA